MQKISGHEHPLKKIFSDDFRFEIPPYQRPYSWEPEQAKQLFTDLFQHYEEKPTGDNSEPYFLGSLVLKKLDTEANAEVIDGQQRLTTLTLLLAVLHDRVAEDKRSHVLTYINAPGNPVEGLEPEPRLRLRPRDADFFQRHVQTAGGLTTLAALNESKLTDPRKFIRANAMALHAEVEKLTPEQAFAFLKTVMNDCYLVAVSTPTVQSAFRIFSVLNDRGLDLRATDILKSEIIGKIKTDAAQEAYTEKWEDIEDAVGREGLNDLFVHIRTIFRKQRAKRSLLDEFREFVVATEPSPEKLIDDVIVRYANEYAWLTTQSYESIKGAEKVNSSLRWLNRIDNYDWLPPALLFAKDHSGDPVATGTFLEMLERLAASMLVQRFDINERANRYAEVLTAIEKEGRSVLNIGGPLDLSTDEKKRVLERLDGDLYNFNKIARGYILLRLDSFLADVGAEYDHTILTVEHVLPQTVTPGTEWEQWWPSEEQRDGWVHRLGNLLLLSRKKNSEASNWDFAIKKEKYFTGRNGVSKFALTTDVLNSNEWNPATVEDRHQRMLGALTKGWNLKA